MDNISAELANLKSELLCEFDSRLTQALDTVRYDVFVILDRDSTLTHTTIMERPPTSNIAAVTPISSRPSDMDRASQNAPQRNAPKRRLNQYYGSNPCYSYENSFETKFD